LLAERSDVQQLILRAFELLLLQDSGLLPEEDIVSDPAQLIPVFHRLAGV